MKLLLISPSRDITMPMFIFAILSVLLFPVSGFAKGELMVSPTRVVFDDRTRSAQVSLVNSSDEATTYRISFVRKRMTEMGGFENIEAGNERKDELFSDRLVRFSPRQVTLPPGKAQVIRLLLRKPSSLPHGEYRSHLLFKAVPESKADSIESLAKDKANGVSIQLTPILGISIPVIVRHGVKTLDIKIEDLSIIMDEKKEGHSKLAMQIKRSGDRSSYGDIIVTHTSDSGNKTVVGRVKGLAVYTPNSQRRLEVPLYPNINVDYSRGDFQVIYQTTKEEGKQLLAEAELHQP